jgi:mRNA interferase MazF
VGTRASVPSAGSLRGGDGKVVLDQLRTVDKARLVRRLGALDPDEAAAALEVLRELFAP